MPWSDKKDCNMTSSHVPQTLMLQVQDARLLNPLIRLLRLGAADGSVLPAYQAGAHITVQVTLPDGQVDWRHYSLINLDPHADATAEPTDYLIAVRREDGGRGGSRWMHTQVSVGATLTVEPPRNDFALSPTDGCSVLVAGGIGVTPLVSMAAQRRAEGTPVRLHYAGRSRELMAFLPELQALLGDDLRVHADDEAGAPLDIAALFDACAPADRLHVCGPKVMLDAVLAQAHARGWPPERVHFELFTAPTPVAGDHAFELVLENSGQTLTVPADKSILEVLIEAGTDPMFDCKRGECGVCAVAVLAGEPDHRDYVLSEREKRAGNVIQVCISRCKGQRLVLDL
jgi:ferredoxin-NADP reductase